MSASLSLRRYSGSGAATESDPLTAIVLSGADALSGPDVVAGSNSYECWLRLRVDTAPATAATNFWFRAAPDLPSGVTVKWGVTGSPATPTAAASSIATRALGSDRVIFDTSSLTEVGEYTAYLVLQAQLATSAPSGAIAQQVIDFGWSET